MNNDMIDIVKNHLQDSLLRLRSRLPSGTHSQDVICTTTTIIANTGLGCWYQWRRQQWKITNIEQADEVTIQGAFGDPMKPSIQGLLGPDKLQAVLVPGMKDHIYSLCQLLQPNRISGTNSRIAVLTKNGAIIMTSESCQS